MSKTLTAERAASHLSRFESVTPSMAKADLKNLEDWSVLIGQAVARCFSLANVNQKEAAVLLGREQAQISRWLSGAERAQLDTLFKVERFRQPLVIALAELAQCEVETTIRTRTA